jgi:hypothetical protein
VFTPGRAASRSSPSCHSSPVARTGCASRSRCPQLHTPTLTELYLLLAALTGPTRKHRTLLLHQRGVDSRVQFLQQTELLQPRLASHPHLQTFVTQEGVFFLFVQHGLVVDGGLRLGSEDDGRDDLLLLRLHGAVCTCCGRSLRLISSCHSSSESNSLLESTRELEVLLKESLETARRTWMALGTSRVSWF